MRNEQKPHSSTRFFGVHGKCTRYSNTLQLKLQRAVTSRMRIGYRMSKSSNVHYCVCCELLTRAR